MFDSIALVGVVCRVKKRSSREQQSSLQGFLILTVLKKITYATLLREGGGMGAFNDILPKFMLHLCRPTIRDL